MMVAAACALQGAAAEESTQTVPALEIPHLGGPLEIDGKLDEACYKSAPLVDKFIVAGTDGAESSPTRAWLFWNEDRLVFAYDVHDDVVVTSASTGRERDVLPQDRVELFLWSGKDADAYYSIEHAPGGGLIDTKARFSKKVDFEWSAPHYRAAFSITPQGYTAEGEWRREGLESLGFKLKAGEEWRVGLFTADYDSTAPKSEAQWITWVDRPGKPANFHVPDAFGRVVLKK